MGMPSQSPCHVSGGGAKLPGHQARPPGDVWLSHSTEWLASEHINQATAAAQSRLFGSGMDDLETRRLMDYRRMSTTSHSQLLNICRNFAQLAHCVLGHQGTEHVTDTVSAFIAALHCGVASSIIFSDNSHWRCIHFDPIRRKVMCIDPYGNGKPTICFSQDLKAALQDMLQQWCPAWTVEETQLIMQHRSDEHSCGVWTIWLADEWMQFVQAGLPGPGFEYWLSQKETTPLTASGLPKQDVLRAYYGRLITDIGDMDPVATRPLFRPMYFANLFTYWLAQREDHGGLCMQALGRGMIARQTSTNEPEDLTISETHPKAEARAKAHHNQRDCCNVVCTSRPSRSMDGRQAKGNAPIAPIAQAGRLRTKNTSCQKIYTDAANGRAPCTAQERGTIAQRKSAPSVKIKEAAAPPEHLPKQQRCIAECWIESSQVRPLERAASKLPHKPTGLLSAECRNSSFGLRILCWNVMGLTTVKEELEELLQRQDPDIIILSETKLTERTQRKCWLNNMLKTHWLQFSSRPHSSLSQGERQGSGGIAVAVRKSLVPQGCYTRVPVQNQHRSHLLQLMLQPPNSTPVLLQAVYMPFELDARASLYEVIKEACDGKHSIVAGDMNAALFPRDRSTGHKTAIDKQHEDFMTKNILTPADELYRPFSFTVRSLDSSQGVRRSRIDDILVTPGIKEHLVAPCTEVLQATDDSDHLPLLATLELGKIGFVPPLDLKDGTSQPKPGPKFVYPIQKTQLLEFQRCFQETHSHKIHEFADKVEDTADRLNTLTHEWVLPADLNEHNTFHNRRVAAAAAAGISRQKIQELDAQLQNLLQYALPLAMENLTMAKARLDKRYMCRAD